MPMDIKRLLTPPAPVLALPRLRHEPRADPQAPLPPAPEAAAPLAPVLPLRPRQG